MRAHTHTHTHVKSNILVQLITNYEHLNLNEHFSVGVFRPVNFKLFIIFMFIA